jgi:ribosome biogenesis GTPase A
MAMVIQYFPGHMAKTIREIQELASQIDIIYELRDARAPISSKNPIIESILERKPRVQIWTKADLADGPLTNKLARAQTDVVLVVDVHHDPMDRLLAQATKTLLPDVTVVRALVIGIPNVGKSTLINRLSNKTKVNVENRPGVTRHLQWITIHPQLRLLDTPGLLWKKFEDQGVALRLAALGMIPRTHVPTDEIFLFVANYLFKHYPDRFEPVYYYAGSDVLELMEHVAKARGLLRGKSFDEDRVYDIVLLDLQRGKLGRVMLDGSL